jgi:hypothetical protein
MVAIARMMTDPHMKARSVRIEGLGGNNRAHRHRRGKAQRDSTFYYSSYVGLHEAFLFFL